MGQMTFSFMDAAFALATIPIEKRTEADTKKKTKLQPEAELFYAAQSGSKAAIDAILKKHEGLIFGVFRQCHFAKTEENVQAGLLGLWRAIQDYKPETGKFSTYAFYWIRQKIGRSIEEEKFFRKPQTKDKRARAKAYSLDSVEDYAANLPDKRTGTDFDALESTMDLSSILERIPAKDRELLRLHAAGKSLQQLSKRYGLSRERIRQKIEMIMTRLRKTL